MKRSILHIFRNTAKGGETFRQALFFGKTAGYEVHVYFPRFRSFVLCVSNSVVTIELDKSYLFSPETARANACAIASEIGANWVEQEPTGQTASTLPDIARQWSAFSLPRILQSPNPHSWLPSFALGPRVRAVLKQVSVPALLPSACFIAWNQVDILYGGSSNGDKAAAWGLKIAKEANVPVRIITLGSKEDRLMLLRVKLQRLGLLNESVDWVVLHGKRSFHDILQELPRTSLVTLGAYGTSRSKHGDMFAKKAEIALETLPQNLLMVGPECITPPQE